MPDESLVHHRGKPGLESRASQQLCVDRHDDRACRHQDCSKRGRQENPLCHQNAGGQRDGDDVVAGCPPKVLHHLPIACGAKRDYSRHVSRVAPNQDHIAGFDGEVSERTVSRLLRRPRRPPSQTWRTFLTNHVATLVSIDFFTVPTLTGRVLFVFVVLMHNRRRIVHVKVTEHPTAAWTARQMIEAFPNDTAPRWLLRDRDAVYGDTFRRRIAGMGIGEVLSSPSSPWQNPYSYRLIGSIRRECLDHVIVLGERHLRRILTDYLTYYHGSRTHLSLEKDAPTPRRAQAITEGDVVAFPEVGGLHHRYERRAA